MSRQFQPSQAPRRRIPGYLARMILGVLMSLAVWVTERRIRKALRPTGAPVIR